MFSPKKITPPTSPARMAFEERLRRCQTGIGPDHELPDLLRGRKPERFGTHRLARLAGRASGECRRRLHEPGADEQGRPADKQAAPGDAPIF